MSADSFPPLSDKNAVPGYTFQGCFRDKPLRAVPVEQRVSSVDDCAKIAYQRGKGYFAIQYPEGYNPGNSNAELNAAGRTGTGKAQCFIGDDIGADYGYTSCGIFYDWKNRGGKMGGLWSNAVYKLDTVRDKQLQSYMLPNFVGCYRDVLDSRRNLIRRTVRDTKKKSGTDGTMGPNYTREECQRLAKNYGLPYYAMQAPSSLANNNIGWCFIGDVYADGGKVTCTPNRNLEVFMDVNGNKMPSPFMGGGYENAVYKTDDLDKRAQMFGRPENARLELMTNQSPDWMYSGVSIVLIVLLLIVFSIWFNKKFKK